MEIEIIKETPEVPNDALPVLVFVHGAWHGAWCWQENFLPFFAKNGYESYAFDLPNHGQFQNKKGINKQRLSDYVAALKTVLAKINKPYVLIGHSMGCYVIQRYLEAHDCKAAIFLAAANPGKPIWRILIKLTTTFPLSVIRGFFGLNLRLLMNTPEKTRKFLFPKELSNEKVMRYTNLLCAESISFVLFDFLFSSLKARKNFTYPILVQYGAKDEMFTRNDIYPIVALQKAEFIELDEVAHDAMLGPKWEEVASFLLNWLNGKFPASSGAKSKKDSKQKNPKLKVEFPDAVPNLIAKLGKKYIKDAEKKKLLGMGKHKRDN